MKTHGGSKTKLYAVWWTMKQRCEYKKHNRYARYGGRGIKVCDEWDKDFTAFRDWALSHGYKSGLCIDRINNDGDYCPENCQWITQQQNQGKRGNIIFLELNGEKHSMSEWVRITGIPFTTLWNRINNGWTSEEALKTPKKGNPRTEVEITFFENNNFEKSEKESDFI